jgi:hypothetical protein
MSETLTKKQQAEQEREEACEHLREVFKPGDTVKTILRHVSRSGMSRRISVVACEDGSPRDVSWYVAKAMGEPVKGRAGHVQDVGITVGGCGMDMGFHLVYGLSHTLYPSYTCPATERYGDVRCPSSEHVNPGPTKDRFGPSVVHTDSYALNHAWL